MVERMRQWCHGNERQVFRDQPPKETHSSNAMSNPPNPSASLGESTDLHSLVPRPTPFCFTYGSFDATYPAHRSLRPAIFHHKNVDVDRPSVAVGNRPITRLGNFCPRAPQSFQPYAINPVETWTAFVSRRTRSHCYLLLILTRVCFPNPVGNPLCTY